MTVIDFGLIATILGVTLPTAWWQSWQIGKLKSEVVDLHEHVIATKGPVNLGAKLSAMTADIESLRDSILSGFRMMNPESDAALLELRNLNSESKALFRGASEESLAVIERINCFEDNHQSLIDRMRDMASRGDDDVVASNHAAVVSFKRMEIYANETFLEVSRRLNQLRIDVEEQAARTVKLKTGLARRYDQVDRDLESLQERMGKLEVANG